MQPACKCSLVSPWLLVPLRPVRRPTSTDVSHRVVPGPPPSVGWANGLTLARAAPRKPAVDRVLIFDCDGVLVDSEKLSCGAWLPVLDRHGVSAAWAEIEQFIGRSDQDLLAHFRRKSGLCLPDALMREREAEYFSLARDRLQPFPGLAGVLDELRRRGTQLAVASSSRPPKLHFNLTQARLAQYFEVVCSSIEVARGKPAPDLFLWTAERLGARPQTCVVIEDSPYGIQAALAAEMTAIGFTSSHSADALRSAGAHAAFSVYEELLALLAELRTAGVT